MATTMVTPEQDTIVSEIDIAAPADRVFKGIGDAEPVRRRPPSLDVFEMDLGVGGKWRLDLRMPKPYHGVEGIHHHGEVLAIDPPRLLVYARLPNFHTDPKHRSIVRWELTPTKSGTHVKVTHSGPAAERPACKGYAGGWPGRLEELRRLAESQSGEHS